jgi:uncharacterized membrane protein
MTELRPRAASPERTAPLVGAGLLLGIGLGGFLDGIALHQILQWHSMLSSRVPPVDLVTMKYNMMWDGLFHAATWAVTLAGVVLLFRAGRRPDVAWSGRVLGGSMLAGWGLFNFVEGLVDHHLLGIHHVRPGEQQLAWDLAFLASGVIFVVAGAAIARARRGAPSGVRVPTVPVPDGT